MGPEEGFYFAPRLPYLGFVPGLNSGHRWPQNPSPKFSGFRFQAQFQACNVYSIQMLILVGIPKLHSLEKNFNFDFRTAEIVYNSFALFKLLPLCLQNLMLRSFIIAIRSYMCDVVIHFVHHATICSHFWLFGTASPGKCQLTCIRSHDQFSGSANKQCR